MARADKKLGLQWRKTYGKTRVSFIWNSTYRTGILFIPSCNSKELQKIASKYGLEREVIAIGPGGGKMLHNVDNELTLIALSESCNNKTATIAHEAFHFVVRIFNNRGILIEVENDEPGAYLLGWAVAAMEAEL